jgi:hypothetical protein
MLEIIKNYIAKRDAKLEYQEALKRFLEDGRVDTSHERYLEHLASQFGIDKSELRRFHQDAVSAFFEKVANDGSINEEEKKALRSIVHIHRPGNHRVRLYARTIRPALLARPDRKRHPSNHGEEGTQRRSAKEGSAALVHRRNTEEVATRNCGSRDPGQTVAAPSD